jgi:hypothetical protein
MGLGMGTGLAVGAAAGVSERVEENLEREDSYGGDGGAFCVGAMGAVNVLA